MLSWCCAFHHTWCSMHWCFFLVLSQRTGATHLNSEESTWETGATLKPKLCRPVHHGKMGCLHGKYRGTFPNTFRDRGAGEFSKNHGEVGWNIGVHLNHKCEKKTMMRNGRSIFWGPVLLNHSNMFQIIEVCICLDRCIICTGSPKLLGP